MRRALVAAVLSLLIAMPALADESPAASTNPERAAAAGAPLVTGDATPTTTSARTDKAPVRKSRQASTVDAGNKPEASQVKQVPLKAPGDDTVCHTEYPTGSRIGVRHCYSKAVTETAASRIQNEIMRHDLEEMRDRQMRDQLQRASVGMTQAMRVVPGR